MTITDKKVEPSAGIAKKSLVSLITSAIDQTATILEILQVPFSFQVERVAAWCSVVVDVVSMQVGIVRPGTPLGAATLTIAGTVQKFKLSTAFLAVMPTIPGSDPRVVVNKAITDNLPFSSAFTINIAAAAGLFWGAVRVQMDSAGVVSTKVGAQDQAYATEPQALVGCPRPDPGKFDLGTITIQMKTGAAFTAQTTALNGGTVNAVNYNFIPDGFVNVCSADAVFTSANLKFGTPLAVASDRSVNGVGGLLVAKYTSSHTGVLTNGRFEVQYRPWPMSGEVAPAGT